MQTDILFLQLKKWMKCIPNFDKNKSYGVSRGSFALSEAKKSSDSDSSICLSWLVRRTSILAKLRGRAWRAP
jgi:hypothetical protein